MLLIYELRREIRQACSGKLRGSSRPHSLVCSAKAGESIPHGPAQRQPAQYLSAVSKALSSAVQIISTKVKTLELRQILTLIYQENFW